MATAQQAVWVRDEAHLALVEVEELDEERCQVTVVETAELLPWKTPVPTQPIAVPRAELRAIGDGDWKSLKRVIGKAQGAVKELWRGPAFATEAEPEPEATEPAPDAAAESTEEAPK